jgi:hypothetical protein
MPRADPDRRKTKRDKKAKARYNKYKKGGRFRATKIKETDNKD